MKRLILLLLLTFSSITFLKVYSQYGVSDTLAYLRSIELNKSQYIGHPFSDLHDSLKIQIKFFSPFANLSQDKTKETSTSFSFYYAQSIADHYLSYPRLKVCWQPYLNATLSNSMWQNNNSGLWSLGIANYYANAIISDIRVVE